ncbi:transporter substrate-binding domain-containing protein (plasmid) [Phaeobacter sp. BS52]|uniref:transporter substrate-binding domain-containing protein n=1 Tax=Phaeobacter sp. BS52 TaxID=2907241 RepID=UPI003863FCEC
MLVILFVTGPAAATVAMAEPIRMTYEEFHPYSFTDSAGQPQGVSIDIMRRIADAAGQEVVFQRTQNPARHAGGVAQRCGGCDLAAGADPGTAGGGAGDGETGRF